MTGRRYRLRDLGTMFVVVESWTGSAAGRHWSLARALSHLAQLNGDLP